jgi:hypothetical protein
LGVTGSSRGFGEIMCDIFQKMEDVIVIRGTVYLNFVVRYTVPGID